MDWKVLLSYMGAVQGILMACFLFFNKKMGRSGDYLALFTFVFSLGLLESEIAPLLEHPFLFWLPDLVGITSYLYGPLLFLYIRSFSQSQANKTVLSHLLIFFVSIVIVAIVQISEALSGVPLSGNMHSILELIAYEILFLQLFYYAYRSIRLLNIEKNEIPTAFSSWLLFLTYSLLIIYVISYLSTSLSMFGYNVGGILLQIVQFGCVAIVYSFSYHAVIHQNYFKAKEESTPKYNTSPILDENKSEYLDRIMHSMEVEQLYLDPTLTVDKLSKLLGINRLYISQVINESLGKSFPEFINSYRIKKVKSLLESEKGAHFTLQAIAFESGFNSKSSFNNAFKKQMGLTPSAYRKSLL